MTISIAILASFPRKLTWFRRCGFDLVYYAGHLASREEINSLLNWFVIINFRRPCRVLIEAVKALQTTIFSSLATSYVIAVVYADWRFPRSRQLWTILAKSHTHKEEDAKASSSLTTFLALVREKISWFEFYLTASRACLINWNNRQVDSISHWRSGVNIHSVNSTQPQWMTLRRWKYSGKKIRKKK